jgi:hypothetical protein
MMQVVDLTVATRRVALVLTCVLACACVGCAKSKCERTINGVTSCSHIDRDTDAGGGGDDDDAGLDVSDDGGVDADGDAELDAGGR